MMSEAAKEAKRAYQREYYRRAGNAEKHKQRQAAYWERKAAKMAAQAQEAAQTEDVTPAEDNAQMSIDDVTGQTAGNDA